MQKPHKATRRALTRALDIPGEILLDEPRFVLEGGHTLRCENHKGIVEYTQTLLRLRVEGGEVRVEGEALVLDECGCGLLEVRGNIRMVLLI